ncbi:ras guanine nucleotide exchange factor domain-containing protein, partial [Phyllosticta citribraziliensis]
PSHRARSHSYSTVDDSRSPSFDSNTFKVVIDRPSLKRTKSVDSLHASHPVLDVPIPNYRLGTPRFSTHGTAFLRSSIQTRYSGGDDMRTSIFTRTAPSYDKLFPQPSPMLNRNSLRESDFSSQSGVFFDRPHTFIEPANQASPASPTPHAPSTPISPGVYDSLYANPNDPSVVRYSSAGDIVAATPARLVAHITSPSSLDYELLSDFFLTFRSYLNAKDLVSLLIARLRWAVDRKDDFGRIVRVRTFVALRHWILNYFAEDFIPCILLRQHFCRLVNRLYTDTSNRPDGGGGDVKIIGELKKCWRRTCGSYWTNISVTGKELLSDEIFPGGAADEIPQPGDISDRQAFPVLRPSFEAEVARLASLPDDDEDDGGIESALLKLEGKYERKSSQSSPRHTNLQHRHEQINTEGFVDVSALKNPFPAPSLRGQQPSQTSLRETPRKTEPEQSDMSYSSIPLLDRGTNYYEYYQPTRPDDSTDSALPAPLAPERWRAPKPAAKNDSAGSSMEHVVETDSIRRIPRGGTMPQSPQSPRSPAKSSKAHRSLLANYQDEFDDISSDISSNRPDSRPQSHGVRSFYEDQPADLGPHGNIPRARFPPTPPKDNAGDDFEYNSIDFATFNKGLPTPGFTPPFRSGHGHVQTQSEARNDPRFSFVHEPQVRQEPERSGPKHIPFILAYDSAILAEQFTVIEKDALDEIDWKELIELRWKQSSPQIRDWVEYLRTQEPRGVDVVIARFNIMVKWAVSQCVLTEDLDERVRTIVKYIRIASHARRLRNYATMYQFTVALLSSDCARLHRTWELVPAADRRVLRELENLVQPVKNFYNLRLEMEMASLEDGCIPFVGIYTRDLIYNAQKPATLGEGNGGPLINFERHQTAATIVKSLLRLLEASGRYTMHARSDVISKCLWVAALSDEEIAKRSRALE